MFQRLLICTDFNDGLQRLVHFIPSLAAANIQHVVFLHCVPLWESGEIPRVDKERSEQARQRLSQALNHSSDGIEVQIEITSGKPSDVILQVAEKHCSNLILLGTATRNLIEETFFGSTTIALYEQTQTPLMLMRPQFMTTLTSEELELRCRHLFRRVLLPYDGTPTSKQLIQRLKQAIRQYPEHSLWFVDLCWVVEDVGRRDIPREYYVQQAKAELAQVEQELKTFDLLEVEYRIRQGNPIVEILEEAKDREVSAIAISSSVPNRLVNWSVPSFTKELFRRSWHPVIYVPPTP